MKFGETFYSHLTALNTCCSDKFNNETKPKPYKYTEMKYGETFYSLYTALHEDNLS